MRHSPSHALVLYLLFFCSGVSGLIYQVVWVRVFANVFGNTIYSASIVIAIFMLGLGAGSYAAGAWADRRYAGSPNSMLQAYGKFEAAIASLGLTISALLPHLGDLSARTSWYVRDPAGWYGLSTLSYVARGAIALVLLTPITLLMGGTLTLLIRHLVRRDFTTGSWRIALVYAVNTVGAAVGCFLTDFALVPGYGIRAAQTVAVGLNAVAAAGAFWLAAGRRSQVSRPGAQPPAAGARRPAPSLSLPKRGSRTPHPGSRIPSPASRVLATGLALALSGCAAMGMEIVWFRHFSILLGEFRAVFSMLLTVVLLGLGVGSLAGGVIDRRLRVRLEATRIAPWEAGRNSAMALMIVQGLVVASTLLGLALANATEIDNAATAFAAAHHLQPGGPVSISRSARALAEIWFNARPILIVVGIPAMLMGCAFPFANGVIQDSERSVGRRAGMLYLANTLGAVCGSLITGFLLIPRLGIQRSATALTAAAAFAAVALYFASPVGARTASPPRRALAASLMLSAIAFASWLMLPSDYVLGRALLFPLQRAYAVSEGVTELIAVTDGPDGGRVLVTNGHPMSSTELLSQRYMRAMAHIPLLSIDNPETVLVLCYGVGNTAHAATLNPTVRRVDVVDLSRHVLEHSGYFRDTNGDVLRDPRVSIYVNDGRHHLQMQPEHTYDLITLEPPPIMHAGVAALYSREFYQRARTRLTSRGVISQWLPAFGVSQAMLLSMVRSFVDVFPNAVLVSGASSNLILIGTTTARNEIDPVRIAAALARAPRVQADLQRLDLGSPREIVGMFVASARSLATASRDAEAVTDDRPIQEYGKRSLLDFDEGLPASLVNLRDVASWCPACFVDGRPAAVVDGLDTYLALMNLAYTAPLAGTARTVPAGAPIRPVAGSGYLGAIIPQSAALDAVLHDGFVGKYQQATDLLVQRHYTEAADGFRLALQLNPESVEAHNNLGIALASQGKMSEAVDQFRQALAIAPGFDDARRNLERATGGR